MASGCQGKQKQKSGNIVKELTGKGENMTEY
jgi:hypothetical protein